MMFTYFKNVKEEVKYQMLTFQSKKSNVIKARDWSPKFETGLNIIIDIVQKV